MTTLQTQMTEMLAKTGIPHRRINCYGSQIVVTALSRKATQQWVAVLSKVATIRGVIESLDETQASGPNKKKYVKTHVVYARI